MYMRQRLERANHTFVAGLQRGGAAGGDGGWPGGDSDAGDADDAQLAWLDAQEDGSGDDIGSLAWFHSDSQVSDPMWLAAQDGS